jgi:hypothetical protein
MYIAFGFTVTSAVFVLADSLFFGSLTVLIDGTAVHLHNAAPLLHSLLLHHSPFQYFTLIDVKVR